MSAMSVTAEAARRTLDAAKEDDDLVKRYLDGDRNAFAYMQGLMQAAYPDAGPGEDADQSPRPAADLPATPTGDGGGAAMPDWLREAGDAGFAPPKSPAHYQFDYAPNAEIDPDFDRVARDWMFKAGLPAGWAAEIARDYQRRAANPPSADEIAQEREAVLGRLRQDWGNATDQKLAQVRDLVLRAGDDRLAETLDRSGLGNNEWLARQLAILADRSAAKAAGKGKSEGSEGSESNGDTGPVYRDIAYRPGDAAGSTATVDATATSPKPELLVQTADMSSYGVAHSNLASDDEDNLFPSIFDLPGTSLEKLKKRQERRARAEAETHKPRAVIVDTPDGPYLMLRNYKGKL